MLARFVNSARFAGRALLSSARIPAGPYRVNLMLTSRCNQSCRHCGIWDRPPQDLATGMIRNLLHSSSGGLSWLDLAGGEIVLRPDILEVVDLVLSRCRELSRLHFATNGTRPDLVDEVVRMIAARKGPRVVVTVSLDGPPGVHEAIRGSAHSFMSSIDTYQRLRKIRGCDVYLGMTLGSRNLGFYEDTLKAVARHIPGFGPADLHVNLPNPAGHYYGKIPEASAKPIEIKQEIDKILAARKKNGRGQSPLEIVERRYLEQALVYLDEKTSPLPCRALTASCFVDADGTVYPCIMWDRPLGSLAASGGDLRAIWHGRAAQDARRTLAEEGCPGCWTPCEAIPAILADALSCAFGSRRPEKGASPGNGRG